MGLGNYRNSHHGITCVAIIFMKHMKNKELKKYQQMLLSIMELNQAGSGVISVPIATFLKGFNKYWNKFHAKEFAK